MFIIDAHQDIAYNALCFARDYRLSTAEKRKHESGGDHPNGIATLGLPDALLGRVAITFATLFTEPVNSMMPMSAHSIRYKTPKEAYQQALNQLDNYRRMADETDTVRVIQTQRDLESVVRSWAPRATATDHKQGMVLLMENGDPITEPRQFEEWYERGVRIVGPAWMASRYCGGTGQPGGLTTLGYELLDVMASFKAILDVSHMAEQAFFEALDHYTGTIIASHSNPRYFRNTDRHLSDEMIRRLAERDGVMGVVMFNRFMSETWQKGDPKSDVPFQRIIEIIDYVCQVTGSAAHIGLGSDFDGGFGAESVPAGIQTVMDLWKIGEALRQHGYSESDIEAVLSGNFMRKLREALPA